MDLVWGEGPKPCDILILGEAPGKNEQEQLQPFVGTAGQILNDALAEAGIPRETVFVTNVYKNRPPNNRKPSPLEIREHEPWLIREFCSVKPKFVLLLGNTALETVTGSGRISNRHGSRVFSATIPFENAYLYATYHPAATAYNRALLEDFQRDVKSFARIAKGAYTLKT